MDRAAHSHLYSDYHNNQSLYDSHFTAASRPQENEENWFTEQRAYSRSVLAGWSLPLGELPYSQDNEQTLRCLVELIKFRQRDLQFRSKAKDDIAAINFQKEKYRSYMEQANRNLEECNRKLGRVENESSDLKNKSRRSEVQGKKERDDDKKMIGMLRTKNEQILHEIKKKEQEVNRVKEQMKKSVGEKSLVQAKNSFELFQGVSPSKKDPAYKQEEAKYVFLLERSEREMGHLVRENGVLREKLFEVRDHLLEFNEWVDRELFGSTEVDKYKQKTRFPLNHNLIFKKESLVDEFGELIDTAKDGILQLRSHFRGETAQKTRSSELLPNLNREGVEQLNFKKKRAKPELSKTDRNRRQSKGKLTPVNKKSENSFPQTVSPRNRKPIPVPTFDSPSDSKPPTSTGHLNKGFEVKLSQIKIKSPMASEGELPFEDELMSDLTENHDSSIVSHIEVEKLGKNRFDKWDILYQDDES